MLLALIGQIHAIYKRCSLDTIFTQPQTALAGCLANCLGVIHFFRFCQITGTANEGVGNKSPPSMPRISYSIKHLGSVLHIIVY